MKISKLFAITLQSKTRLIFFFVAEVYNLLLGLYLKDFLVLSPMLLTFYLLSALPALFLLIDVRSKSMRAVIFVSVGLILLMNIAALISAYNFVCKPEALYLSNGGATLWDTQTVEYAIKQGKTVINLADETDT